MEKSSIAKAISIEKVIFSKTLSFSFSWQNFATSWTNTSHIICHESDNPDRTNMNKIACAF